MSYYSISSTLANSIADAVKTKRNLSVIRAADIPAQILAIEGGGASVSNTVGGNNYFSLVDMFYGTDDYTPAWGTQQLNGELYVNDYGSTKWKKYNFTELRASQYDVAFLNEGSTVYSFSPSYEESYIALSGEQTVSPSFKTWFDGAWIATDESNIPDISEPVITELLLPVGTFTSSTYYNYPPSYTKFPPSYDITIPFNAELIVPNSGYDSITITQLRITGGNGEDAAPYPSFSFIQDSGMPWNFEGYNFPSMDRITLKTYIENTVPVIVYTNLTTMFNYQSN